MDDAWSHWRNWFAPDGGRHAAQVGAGGAAVDAGGAGPDAGGEVLAGPIVVAMDQVLRGQQPHLAALRVVGRRGVGALPVVQKSRQGLLFAEVRCVGQREADVRRLAAIWSSLHVVSKERAFRVLQVQVGGVFDRNDGKDLVGDEIGGDCMYMTLKFVSSTSTWPSRSDGWGTERGSFEGIKKAPETGLGIWRRRERD
jgi:hypothetical protein